MLNPVKLLDKVLPKELVGLILQHEIDGINGNIPAFQYKELRAKIDRLDNNEWKEYKAYLELQDILGVLEAESKIAALMVLWRLSMFNMKIIYAKEQYDMGMLQRLQEISIRNLKRFYITQALFVIIDDAMGCDTSCFITNEAQQLDSTLKIYYSIVGYIEDQLMEAAYNRGEDIDDKQFFIPIDKESLKPSPDILEKAKACFDNPKGRSLWDMVELVRGDFH